MQDKININVAKWILLTSIIIIAIIFTLANLRDFEENLNFCHEHNFNGTTLNNQCYKIENDSVVYKSYTKYNNKHYFIGE